MVFQGQKLFSMIKDNSVVCESGSLMLTSNSLLLDFLLEPCFSDHRLNMKFLEGDTYFISIHFSDESQIQMQIHLDNLEAMKFRMKSHSLD